MKVLVCALAAASGLSLAVPAAADVPAGTVLELRLLTSLASYSSKTGDAVEAMVVSPACPRGLPAGATVSGVVTRVHKVGLGLIHESASMEVEFRELRLPEGQRYGLRGRLLGVENARERVDRHGTIRGIRATASLSNRLSSRLFFGIEDHPYFLIPLFVVETAVFRFPDPEISYGPGTELSLQLEGAIPTAELGGCSDTERQASPDESADLEELVAGVPAWTYTRKRPVPTDPTNLVFLGSREAVDRAFGAAGWNGSQSMSMATGVRMVRAIAEGNGYADAPMRTLLLDGAEPDISRQKSLNTFGKRDHLRMWKRTETFRGQTVWAAAATKDVAVAFSLRTFGFTHEIQNDVDLERDKVVSDLVFTGCVESVSYVRRSGVAGFAFLDGRKSLTTDARVAVVSLNSCETARLSSARAAEFPPVPLAVRCVRRVTLTARSHILRDHMLWKRGEAAWMGYRIARYWVQARLSQRRALAASRDQAEAVVPNQAAAVLPNIEPPGNLGGSDTHTIYGVPPEPSFPLGFLIPPANIPSYIP
jgi:hypothetical protein